MRQAVNLCGTSPAPSTFVSVGFLWDLKRVEPGMWYTFLCGSVLGVWAVQPLVPGSVRGGSLSWCMVLILTFRRMNLEDAVN